MRYRFQCLREEHSGLKKQAKALGHRRPSLTVIVPVDPVKAGVHCVCGHLFEPDAFNCKRCGKVKEEVVKEREREHVSPVSQKERGKQPHFQQPGGISRTKTSPIMTQAARDAAPRKSEFQATGNPSGVL